MYNYDENSHPAFILAKDHDFERIMENKAKKYFDRIDAIDNCPNQPAGKKEDGARTLLEIIRWMVKTEHYHLCMAWTDVYQTGDDTDDNLLDALNWVCIEEGLSDDDFMPAIVSHTNSWDFEIYLHTS